MNDLDPSVSSIAIEAMDAGAFEAFGQVLLAEAIGAAFEPTGGLADGGQDGFLRSKRGKPSHYIQISKEKDIRGKIRRTINRLNESDRNPDALTFLSSENFPTRDLFEAEIEKETGVEVRIHDRAWIIAQISLSPSLRDIFAQRSATALKSAHRILSSTIQMHSAAEQMSVLVYMDAHARSAPQETDLLTLAVDAAIYQALEGTDPDKGLFKSEQEVSDFVTSRFPAVKGRASVDISARLTRLSSKKNNPRIRHHRNVAGYCLPYDVRNELSQENAAIKELEFRFIESVRERARQIPGLSSGDIDLATNVAVGAVIKTYEQQGLNLAASFSSNGEYNEVKTYDIVQHEIKSLCIDDQRSGLIVDAVENLLRQVFYSSCEVERLYLFKLFKMLSVEFVMRGDDKVASFFKNVVGNLHLHVGTDIIIRSLSENFLQPSNQSTQNTLRILSQMGATLLITEHVLEEVYTHIIAENKEFENHYAPWLRHASLDGVKQSDRILIRAFFYAFLQPERHAAPVKSWRNFLARMGDPAWFDERGHKEDFATYLMRKFGLEFVSRDEVEKGVAPSLVRRFKENILRYRGNELLAENDAKIALFINRVRKDSSENISKSVYGYTTWWLTEEYHVVQAAEATKVPHRFAMQPQFLMNFCVASPAMRQTTDNMAAFFPTNFGLRITDRVPEAELRSFLDKANAAATAEDAVASARIRSLLNHLKGANYERERAAEAAVA